MAPLVVAYSVAALAIGLLVGALLRRTLAGVAVAAVGISVCGSPSASTRARTTCLRYAAWAPATATVVPTGANPLYLVENAWADAFGHVKAYPPECSLAQGERASLVCLSAHGIAHRVSVYESGTTGSGLPARRGRSVDGLLAAGSTALAVVAIRRR